MPASLPTKHFPRRFWRLGILCLLPLAPLGLGCRTASTGLGTVTLVRPSSKASATTHSTTPYTAYFRGFHRPDFPQDNWEVVQGVLRSLPGSGVDLITIETYEDFSLDLSWKVTEGANSGILYGVSEATGETYWSGPEYQINDDPHHEDGRTPKHSAGSLYDLMPPNALKRLKRTGLWNQTHIQSRGGHVEHWLNGAKILEYDWTSPEMRQRIAQSKFADQPLFMKRRNGHIALQHHGDEVWFKDIRIIRY